MSIQIRDASNAGQLVSVDAQGHLFTMNSPAASSTTAAAWSSGTAINAEYILLSSGGYPALTIQLNQVGTISGGAITFEGTYDGVNWLTIATTQVLNPSTFAQLTNPYTLVSNVNAPFLVIVQGYQQIRIRLSTVITGIGTVTPYWTLLSVNPFSGTITISGTVSVTGTVTANQGGAPWSQNLIEVGGTAISLGQTTMSASLPVVIASNQSAIPVSQSGNWTVTSNAGTGTFNTQDAADGTPGSAAPATATQIGGTDGTNLQAISTDSSGNVNVNVLNSPAVTVSGTVAVTQSTSPWVVSGTVTANAGTGNFATNLTQVGGTSVATAAAGIQKVGVTDSNGNGITSTGNALDVNIASSGATVTVSGTVAATQSGTWNIGTVATITNPVTVNQGTSPWVTDDANAVAQGTLLTGIDGFLQMGSVTTAPPAYTNGEISPLSLDPAGNLRVAIEGSIIASNNITEWNSVALGSPSAYGTSPGAVNVIGTNAFVTNTVAVSGTVTANAGTGNFTVVQGTAASLNATVVGTGTFAVQAAQSGTWNIATVTAVTAITNALPAGTNVIGHVITDTGSTTAVTGTVAVTQSTSPWVVSLTSTTITGTVAVTQSGTWNVGTLTSITNPVTVVGDSASGASNAGNPVKIGGVFNTTQPTVTNGQTVDAQFTARGAQIVAVGVDGFAVTVGGTVAVTQSTSPWVVSLTSTTITGTVAVTQSTS